ncbi:hypothetical protein OIDMADRAFT_19995 [Oidiodendron maius Zn]|uniref:Uncharacterized protein n=1 Tax=Oidiodendron maius (strain Zn) TaxID=913774 RepID=A0A0C3H7G3_OIDMZ|nr:hypothetical protein OIDMADRAFT_19995 [Oidiodendron maius Zn]
MNPGVYGAYFMGISSIFLGLLALISPSTAADLFGVRLPSSSSSPSSPHSTSATAFLAAKGARDITLGICYLALGYEQELRIVRIMMLAHMVTGVIDALVVWAQRGESKEKRVWTYGIGTAGLLVALMVGF